MAASSRRRRRRSTDRPLTRTCPIKKIQGAFAVASRILVGQYLSTNIRKSQENIARTTKKDKKCSERRRTVGESTGSLVVARYIYIYKYFFIQQNNGCRDVADVQGPVSQRR